MTNEQAIETIKTAIAEVEWEYPMDYAVAFDMAIEALYQPEIIYCGNCKYKDDGIDEEGVPFLKCLNGRNYGGVRMIDYCSWAERKGNG